MTTQTQKQKQTHTDIIDAAIDALTDIRVWPDDIAVGCGGDQGDLLMWRITDAEFEAMEIVTDVPHTLQLAPGTSQGSRHTVCTDYVEVRKPKNFGMFNGARGIKPKGHIIGYALRFKARSRISHPEHADHSIPAICIQTAGQVDSKTLAWVKD